jgi:ribosome-binding protein aMBF1 (putative translation factor)
MNSQIRYYAYSMKNRKLEFEMKAKSYICKICGMLFLNSIERTVHEINIHVDKLYQCQSCYKILRNTDEFNEHIKRVHSRSAPSLHSSVQSSSLASNNNIKKYNMQEEEEKLE